MYLHFPVSYLDQLCHLLGQLLHVLLGLLLRSVLHSPVSYLDQLCHLGQLLLVLYSR